MKHFFAIAFLLLSFNQLFSQSNPTAQTLPFNFSSQTGNSLPAGMAVHRFGTTAAAIPTTRTTVPGNGDLSYVTTANSGGWRDEGANGLSILASGSQAAGALIVSINTTGKTNVQVNWTVSTILQPASRDNSIALQYRIGSSGNFIDVGSSSTFSSTGTISGTAANYSEILPAAANNQPEVQVRWIYWESTGTTGSRDRLAIDEITIDGNTIVSNSVSVAAGSNAAEPSTLGNFTINFSSITTESTDISYDFTGSAGFGTDYTVSFLTGSSSSTTNSGILTVPAGTNSVTVNIIPGNDEVIEPVKNISLTISSPTGGYALGTNNASINLTDDDVAPTISVASGNNAAEPATNGTFTITLSSPAPAGGVTVNYTLTGTATAGTDYTDGLNGSVIIPEGSSSATITLTVSDDPSIEGIETINITLNNATSPYTITTSTAVINLVDNDTAPLSFTGIYTQDFNSLANTLTGNTWTNNTTIPGWYSTRATYNAGDGSSNAGALYSLGTTGTTERALGTVGSGSTGTIYYGLRLVNNTGAPITSLKVVYKGEQWRNGGNASAQTVNFAYQNGTSLTSLSSGTWNNVTNLNFTSPVVGLGSTALVGDLPANSAVLNYTITGINIAAGEELMIRWEDIDHGGSDHALAIDSLFVEANPADLVAPVITSLSPLNGATDVSMNFTATVRFDENIQKGTGNILVKNAADNSVVRTIDVSSSNVTVSGTSVSFALSLANNTGYYIEIDNGAIEDLAGNDFGISGNSTWAFNTGSVFYTADFNSCSSSISDGFTQYSVTGSITWACTPFGRDPANPSGTAPFPNAVQMNGFAGGTNVPNVDWLISPSFDLTGTTYPLLSFWSRTAFNGLPLQLKVSTDYTGGDPSLATWTDINGRFPMQATNIWTLSSNINLAAFKQPNVHIAFVYESSDDDGARWTVDDFKIDNSATPPPPNLTTSTTDVQYSYVAAGASADKTFNFTGNDLTGDVTISASADFLVSKDGTTFSSSINYTEAEANNIQKTVYVRFAPSQNGQDYSGTVTVSTSGLTNTINLKGSSIDPATTLEVVNWNIEWFGHTGNGPTNEVQQQQNVKTILQNIGADIFGLIEVVDESKLAAVVSQMPGYAYVISDFGSHTNTTVNPPSALAEAQKLAFVYKTSVFSNITTQALLSQGSNSSADITSNPAYNYFSSGRFPYMLTADVTLNCVTQKVRFVLVHAKANTSPTDVSYNRRKRSADTLYYTLNNLYPDDNIVVFGDINDDLDQSITAGFTTTSWSAFTNDANNYTPVTLPLSLAGRKSTVSYNDVIDHVIISNDMNSYYMNSTANILSDVSSLVSNYGSTTSDHYPVFSRYRFGNPTTVPVVTSCPVVAPVCANGNTTVTIPVFTATPVCGNINYSYAITGATVRSGTTNNATGTFNIGTSTIIWTATDEFGNSSTCSTTVTIYQNPTVTIPDVFAMNKGVVANTVYLGYTPASSVTLTPIVTGGAVNYSWTGGASTSSITVSPTTNTTYSVTVRDNNGCEATANKLIKVIDARANKHTDKISVCHKGNTLAIPSDKVSEHLAHGDMLGSCTINQPPASLTVKASPNPSSNQFVVTIETSKQDEKINLRVINFLGTVIEQKTNLNPNQTVTLGNNYAPGLYMIEVTQGNQKSEVRVIKF